MMRTRKSKGTVSVILGDQFTRLSLEINSTTIVSVEVNISIY